MPKITVAYEFADQDEFAKHFGISFPSDAAVEKKVETKSLPQLQVVQPTAPVAEQPVAPIGAAAATIKDCVAAYKRHIAKPGNSAMTGRAATVKALPHFVNFAALTPEECAVAIAAMDAA